MRLIALPIALLLCLCASPAFALWPRCEVVSGTLGGPAILIDGQVNAPLLFCGNNQFGKDDLLITEQQLAAEAGIDIFVFGVGLDMTDEAIDETVAKFAGATPQGHFYVRLSVRPGKPWLDGHPDDRIRREDGSTLPVASPYSAAYRDWAAERTRDVVKRIANGPYGEQFIGIGLCNLHTSEWFFPDTDAYWDYSPAGLTAWRDWLRVTYGKDKRLQQAWGQDAATIDTAVVPTSAARENADWGPFRDPVRNRPAMDYTRFLSEGIADTIIGLAQAVKAETRDRSLVGAFYGYTFELNHNGARALAHSGHLALGKLLDNPAIDIIQAPFSYYKRAPGDAGTYHLPLDSIALHGKLLILEEDTYTHLATPPAEGLIAPGYKDRPADLEGTLSLSRRNFAAAFSHGAGMWFFDLLSDGRWNDRTFWNSAVLFRRIAAEGRSHAFTPEVAFVVSEESVAALRDTTHPELVQTLGHWRDAFATLGAPVGYYLQRDLLNLPSSVKMVVLANPFIVTKDESTAIKAFTKRGGTVVFVRAPGLVGDDGLDVAGIESLTGVAVEARFDRGASQISLAGSGEVIPLGAIDWQPRFVALPNEKATVLATYADTGESAAVRLPRGDGAAVYSAVPRLPAELLRTLAEAAGVSLYTDSDIGVSVLGNYLFVHSPATERYVFSWPTPFDGVDRIAPGRATTVALDGTTWEDVIPEKTTHVYRVRETGMRPGSTNGIFGR